MVFVTFVVPGLKLMSRCTRSIVKGKGAYAPSSLLLLLLLLLLSLSLSLSAMGGLAFWESCTSIDSHWS
jgi:hypothetical protein